MYIKINESEIADDYPEPAQYEKVCCPLLSSRRQMSLHAHAVSESPLHAENKPSERLQSPCFLAWVIRAEHAAAKGRDCILLVQIAMASPIVLSMICKGTERVPFT